MARCQQEKQEEVALWRHGDQARLLTGGNFPCARTVPGTACGIGADLSVNRPLRSVAAVRLQLFLAT